MSAKRKKKVNGKQKGSRGELELAHLFQELGLTARRTQQFCGNTGDASDVVCEELPNLHIECKRTEQFQLYKAMAQAIHDAGKKLPVVFHRRNGNEWVAVLEARKFIKLLKLLKGL